MGRKTQDTNKAEENNKVVTMPQTGSGKDGEETEKSKKKTAAKKTGPRNCKKDARKSDEEGPAAGLEKKEGKGSKKGLRHWVKKLVKDDAEAIAGRLLEETKAGDARSAATVLSLMEKKRKGGEDDGFDGPSLADQLMEGPTWEEVLEARRKAREEEEKTEAA
jgi:hypothetical protein